MAKKKEKVNVLPPQEIILQNEMDEILSTGFGRYSKYVLQERAVPDVRDGLKPVQRRIIYTMYLDNNIHIKPTRKCARTVGAVIGRFHPHGDTSVYEAMVRLSQDWKMAVPLIDFQGNNGSIDGDGPAAYRYTEARLSEISSHLIRDLNKNTVDMELNFDDQELEPQVLPCRFPNILVNGSSGVAVGASTDIPPHNLGEVIDATVYRLTHKKTTNADLLKFIKGPDFPTGGIIINPETFEKTYETGKGIIRLMAKTHIEHDANTNQIVITEIPYGIEKSALVSSIFKYKSQSSFNSITEVRDETDKDGLRIVIELKKDVDATSTLNYIISKNLLTTSIKFNMLVIDHYRPSVLSLLRVIDCYIEHQMDVITRRSNYDLEKAVNRHHIVEGLLRLTSKDCLDKVIAIIRSSKDKNHSRVRLIEELSFSEKQAEAILNLQLYRLNNFDIKALQDELVELEKTINELREILENEDKMKNLIARDLKEIKNKYPVERKTQIQNGIEETKVDMKDLITKEDVMISVSRDAYIKRSSLKSYQSTPNSLPGLKDGDVLRGMHQASTTDTLLLFTSLGNFLSIPVYTLIDTKWKDIGQHINEIGSLSNAEKIVNAIVVKEFKDGIHIVLASKLGQIKKVPLKEFITSRVGKTANCFKLRKDDELINALFTKGDNNVLTINSKGQASLYSEIDVPTYSLRSGGNKAMKTSSDKDTLAQIMVFDPKENCRLALISKEHGLRVIDYSQITPTERGQSLTNLYKSFKIEPHEFLKAFKFTKKDEIKIANVILENRIRCSIDFEEQRPMPIESYLKKNLQLNNDSQIVDVSIEEIPVISQDIEVVIPKKVEAKANKKEYIQMSLFDSFDD